MVLPSSPPKPRVTVERSFVLEAASLCILDITLTNFGSPDSLLFRSNTEGVDIAAAEAIPSTRSGASTGAMSAMLALHWRARPPFLRLVCRSEKVSAALAISNFETTSLAHSVASMDAHRLLALAGILHSTGSEVRAPHAYILEEIRKAGRREFFLNWLPAPEDRFVCLVMQAGIQDPAGLRLHPLANIKAPTEWLLPVSHSVKDNNVIIIYDLNGVDDPDSPVEIATVIQDKIHCWRLGPRSENLNPAAETEQLVRLATRWTDNVCETIAMARSDLLVDRAWESPESRSGAVKFQSNIRSLLIVTDVVDMFGLTLVMAAAENWRTIYDRIFLLLPCWKEKLISPAIEPLALIENFGGSEVIEPITSDELGVIFQSLEPGMSISFASAAAPYNNHIDEGGRTELPIATFDLSSPARLLFIRKLAQYAISAGGPLVWRELQSAFASTDGEGISTTLLSDTQNPSLVDDLYALPCSSLGWPLRAFQQFDRHMLAAFRSGELE